MYVKYLNIDYLNNLRIQYVPEINSVSSIYGDFSTIGPNRGLITIYNSTSFKDCSKYVLSHEFLHTFTKYDGDYNYIYEGTEAPKACPACLHPQSYFEVKKTNY